MSSRLVVVFFGLIFLQVYGLRAQNLKTSHLMWNLPTYNNAALTSSGFSRITADFRNAKLSEGISFNSALLWLDYPVVVNQKNKGAFFILFEKEKSGNTVDFSTLRANLAFSKKIVLNRQSHLQFGLGMGYRQFGLSLDGLSTSSQFVEGIGFDTSLPNGELTGSYRTSYFTINSGLFYQAISVNQARLLKLGISAHNLNKQLQSWEGRTSKLPVQYSAQFQYLAFTGPRVALGPDAVVFSDEQTIHGTGGLLLRYFINSPDNSLDNEEGRHINAFVRVASQKKGILGLQYKSEKYAIGLSYDVPFGNLSHLYGNAFEVLFTLTPEVRGKSKTRRTRLKKSKSLKAPSDEKEQVYVTPQDLSPQTSSIKDIGSPIEVDTAQTVTDETSQRGTVQAGEISSSQFPATPVVNAVYFVFASSELDPGSKKHLKEIYEVYLKGDGYRISITGHTDNIGSGDDNQRLSVARAEKVLKYLVELGVSPQKVAIAGKGEDDPIASNDTPEGRAENRRVEITLINN